MKISFQKLLVTFVIWRLWLNRAIISPLPERELSQLAALRQTGAFRTHPAPFSFNLKPSTLNLSPLAFAILAPQ